MLVTITFSLSHIVIYLSQKQVFHFIISSANEEKNLFLGQVDNIVGQEENTGYQHFLLFPQCSQKASSQGYKKLGSCFNRLTHYQTTVLNSSKLKDFADDNSKFEENDKVSQTVRKHMGKGGIARYEQFLLFPKCFQKAFSQECQKRCHCVGMS